MRSVSLFVFLSVICACGVSNVRGHGRLLIPPARGTLWRDPRFALLAKELQIQNYNDNGLNCGGFATQWYKNGGKCGICGDPYHIHPRPHEAPDGKYAKNIIVESYTEGEIINVTVQLTANHRGWFEFRICPHEDRQTEATQACLDQRVLKIAGGLGRRVHVKDAQFRYHVKLQLPKGLSCTRCVFQWKYHAGNNWGVDEVTGKGCVGCGRKQEEFYGCSDVAIVPSGGGGGEVPTTTTAPTTTAMVSNPHCKGAGILRHSKEVAQRCKTACARGCCPAELCNDACRNP